jgi:hypothetical protein
LIFLRKLPLGGTDSAAAEDIFGKDIPEFARTSLPRRPERVYSRGHIRLCSLPGRPAEIEGLAQKNNDLGNDQDHGKKGVYELRQQRRQT